MVELSILGISLQEDGKTPVLLLHPHGMQRILSLRIGPFEAFAISTAIHESEREAEKNAKEAPASDIQGLTAEAEQSPWDFLMRPLPHELLVQCITALGGRIASVNLIGMKEGSYTAEIVLNGPSGEIRLECRPSDGAALALRSGSVMQATEEVISHAEDLDMVMASLPDHIRTITAAKLAAMPQKGRISPILETVLSASAEKKRGRQDTHRDIISAARKMLEEERADKILTAILDLNLSEDRDAASGKDKTAEPKHPAPSSEGINRKESSGKLEISPPILLNVSESRDSKNDSSAASQAKSEKAAPTIRISLVRQHPAGEPEVLDEFLFPSSGIPKEVLASLSLSQAEVKAVGNAGSEEDRWATLLRILSPETKVPM